MIQTSTTILRIAYLGAGAFYATSDVAAAGWPKNASDTLAMTMALMVGTILWGPACSLAFVRAAIGGWRPALAHFVATVAPALAIFLGAIIFVSLR